MLAAPTDAKELTEVAIAGSGMVGLGTDARDKALNDSCDVGSCKLDAEVALMRVEVEVSNAEIGE
jgi:hypothetical protein